MKIFAEAGSDERKLLEPVNLLRLKLVLAIDDPDINLEAILVLQQFLDAIIQFQERTDQHQPFGSALDQFF